MTDDQKCALGPEQSAAGEQAAESTAGPGDRTTTLGAQLIQLLQEASLTIAAAESLTGGLVCDALVRTQGASRVFLGGIVAYSNDIKVSELGVDRGLVNNSGAVNGEVAKQMATGAARRLDADVGISTTGVAGPGGQDGRPPGTVFIAAIRAGRTPWVRELALPGDRETVRRNSVIRALELTIEMLSHECRGPRT